MRIRILVVAGLLAAALGLAGMRQGGGNPGPGSELLAALHYRGIGPFRGGRVTAVAGVPGDHRTFYMGATGGGVWKTTDAGEVWQNLSDKFFEVGSVGAIAVAPSDPRVIYVGTGSSFIRNNIELGRGLYRSEDAGASWQLAGLADGGQISRIRVDPRDPRHLYAAVLGHAFGPNSTRGVYRSHDGGRTWQQSFFVDDHTGAADLVMAPDNPDALYAVFWTAVRNPWGIAAGSPQSGIYKTSDAGDHWTKLSAGLPAGAVGRIGIAVSPARPGRLWALVDAGADGGVYRSDDAGANWQKVSSDRTLTGRSWYYADIFADTTDPNLVYAGNTNFYRSRDAGATWEPLPMPHGDNHDLWIDPQDHDVMIEGNDGGACISLDGGATWSSQLNQNTAEIYRIVADDQMPYRLYGAQQDQYDAVSIPSRSTHFGERLGIQHWSAVGGMEGGWVALDPAHPDTVYATGPSAMITRLDIGAKHLRTINATAGGRGGPRFGWSSPVVISPLDPATVYHTSNFVDKSTDGGQTWVSVSPDLTHNQPRAGGRGANGSEAEVYPTIDTFAVSPRDKSLLWAGSDDGMVHLSRDAGASWHDVTPAAIPAEATVNSIEPSPHDPARAYLAVFRYMLDDYQPYIYRTADYGTHWSLLTDGTNGIPADQPVRVVREDPVRAGLLYAGTEFGMYVSYDDGAHWRSLQLDLPHVPVTDLVVHANDLDLATNGRGFWILDDIAPLRELAANSFSAPHLFAPGTAYRVTTSADEDDQAYIGGACCVANFRDLYTGARIERHRVGEEPPDGAPIDVWLPATGATPTALALTVSGADGKPLRTLLDASNAKVLHSGLNRFVWDLHVEPEAPGTAKPAVRGPKAPPGTYQVRLVAGGQPQTVTLRLLGDPSSGVTDQSYQEQYDMLANIEHALAQIQSSNATLQRKLGALPADDPGRAPLQALAAQLGSAGGGRGGGGRGGAVGAGGVTPLAPEFSSLYTFVAGSEDRPTGNAAEKYQELRGQLDALLAKVGN